MTSAIDSTKPTALAPLTADVRSNFAIAASEITALQAGTVPGLAASTGSSLVGWIRAAASAVATTVSAWFSWQSVHVFEFMTIAQIADVQSGTPTLDLTTQFAAALAAVPSNGSLKFSDGVYLGTLSVRRNNISIIGNGSASTTIRHPVKAITNVLELGNTAAGNGATAYSGIVIHGLTLDGNRANVTQGADDFGGHGLPLTKISNYHLSDVRAINCWNSGVGIFIDSNFGYADVYVENCGNGTAGQTTNGFDINSSKYGQYTVVSKNCYAGGRILDNCYGNSIRIAVYNATKDGFNYTNQSVNSSYANTIDLQVYTCGQHGLNINENCRNSNIRATIYNATNNGCVIGDGTGNPCTNLNIDLATYNSGASGLIINSDGNDNIIRHQSYLDGRTGAQGTAFAVDVTGNRNALTVKHHDSATWQVRGVAFRAGATDNVLSLTYDTTADPLNDAGTRSHIWRSTGIDNVPIGATTKSTGAFTTLSSNSTTSLAATTIDNGTNGFVLALKNATGTADQLRIQPQAAGSGPLMQASNNAGGAYAQLNLQASSFNANCKLYPGTDAAAAQTSSGLYAGNGVPSNANGSNGDFYLRGDGTKVGSTVIYHKEVGAWVALTS